MIAKAIDTRRVDGGRGGGEEIDRFVFEQQQLVGKPP